MMHRCFLSGKMEQVSFVHSFNSYPCSLVPKAIAFETFVKSLYNSIVIPFVANPVLSLITFVKYSYVPKKFESNKACFQM